MKRIAFLILWVTATVSASAQSEYHDFILLKNGTMIYGSILEQTGESVTLETSDGNVTVYPIEEVEKITPTRKAKKSQNDRSGRGLDRGYKGVVEMGYGVAIGEYGLDRYRLDFVNGFQFNPIFSAGGGVGLRGYSKYNATAIVLFADFRFNFADGENSPYFSVGLGPAFDVSNSFDGMGMLFDPHLGMSFRISERNFIHAGLGVEFQNLTVTEIKFGEVPGLTGKTVHTSQGTSKALNFTVGVSF